MQTVVYVNNNARKFDGRVVDGGYARNMAWDRWLRIHVANLREVRLKKGKIFHNLQVYRALLFNRGKTIFLQYPQVGVPLFYTNLLEKMLSGFFFRCLTCAVKRNQVVFDICDLKYEQAIDLGYREEVQKYPFEEVEKKLLSAGANYIFASGAMREYACKKYGISMEKTDVCINGGPSGTENCEVPLVPDSEKINYVYAGTLDKGRQIEEMIDGFPEDEKYHFYLLGPSGQWIQNKKRNITVLGPVEEKSAHHFVSLCDVGFIPYDETRLYYQLAYPTKLSFYLTAGIAFISTPVAEVKAVNERTGAGWLASVSEWGDLIRELSGDGIRQKKTAAKEHGARFGWEKILDQNRFIQ